MQYLEKYNSTVQQLAYRGWHQAHRQEELFTGGGKEVGDGRAEGSSAKGDKGQAAISLIPDVDDTGSGSLLDSILSTLLKKRSSDVWVVALILHVPRARALQQEKPP